MQHFFAQIYFPLQLILISLLTSCQLYAADNQEFVSAPNANLSNVASSWLRNEAVVAYGQPSEPIKQISLSLTSLSGSESTTRSPADFNTIPISIVSTQQITTQKPAKVVTSQIAVKKPRYKLPSWFNYELYRSFFGKQPRASARENELAKRIYLSTALKVFEERAKFRANKTNLLTSTNELSDMTSSELEAFKLRRWPKQEANESTSGHDMNNLTNICCTYDQVYKRIIDLLNKTTNGPNVDLIMSGALIDELEQKPFFVPQDNSLESKLLQQKNRAGGEQVSQLTHDAGTHPILMNGGSEQGRDQPSRASWDDLDPKTEAAIIDQLTEHFSQRNPTGRRLIDKLSKYFGQPIEIQVTPRREPLQSKNKTNVV